MSGRLLTSGWSIYWSLAATPCTPRRALISPLARSIRPPGSDTVGIICVVLRGHAYILRAIIMLRMLVTLQQAIRDYRAAPGSGPCFPFSTCALVHRRAQSHTHTQTHTNIDYFKVAKVLLITVFAQETLSWIIKWQSLSLKCLRVPKKV